MVLSECISQGCYLNFEYFGINSGPCLRFSNHLNLIKGFDLKVTKKLTLTQYAQVYYLLSFWRGFIISGSLKSLHYDLSTYN